MKKPKKRTSKSKTRKSKALGAVQNEDRMGTGMAILSYIIPPVGIYQYFANQDDRPKRAKIGGGLAVLGLATGLVYRLAFSNSKVAQKQLEINERAKIRQEQQEKDFFKQANLEIRR